MNPIARAGDIYWIKINIKDWEGDVYLAYYNADINMWELMEFEYFVLPSQVEELVTAVYKPPLNTDPIWKRI